ncbi:MAG: glycosyltransferase family 4 protein [bacterium]|nr:glycosyltransferase family 4 protein [bacterium]
MFEHRLLLLTETFPPAIGGIQSYLSGLWGALPPEQSFVVTSVQPGDRAWDAQQRYRIVRAATNAFRYPRWRPFWQAAREIVRREHIEAIVCGKSLFEGRAALRLQQEFRIPFAACTYETEILVWLSASRTRRQLSETLSAAGRVTVINDGMKQHLFRLGIPEQKIVKFYTGVAEDFFSAPAGIEEFRSRYVLGGKRVVTCVSRLVPRKGIDVLLRAFADVVRDLPDAHLIIVGDGPERARLETLARSLNLARHVYFLGIVPMDDVRRALAVADVFVLTPIVMDVDVEGFGIVYVEAAAAGKPAVGTRTGGIPEAVLDGETGLLVPERDAAATAVALVRLLVDHSLRTRLAATAKARAEKEFHWKGRSVLFQGMMHAVLSEQSSKPRT